VQRYSDAAILEELDQNVRKEDTKAQQIRVEKLATMFSGLNMVEAGELLKRLNAGKKGDKVAADFHYRLSTKTRQKLIAILEKAAGTLPLSSVSKPSDDPKYIDKVIDEVTFGFLYPDRYILRWKGGHTAVFKPDVDTTGKSK